MNETNVPLSRCEEFSASVLSRSKSEKQRTDMQISVSLVDRCPTWQEMCGVKRRFFEPEDCVVQYHPPESTYVNDHPYCLHLWRRRLRLCHAHHSIWSNDSMRSATFVFCAFAIAIAIAIALPVLPLLLLAWLEKHMD